jgi:hypothetical protein
MDGFTSAKTVCRIMAWIDVMDITKWSISGSEKSVPAKDQQSKRLRCAAIVPNYGHYVAYAALPPGFIAPCLPTKTDKLASGSQWLHEIKHDGFRIIARKNGDRVRLYSRPGNDLTYRFPLIVEPKPSAQCTKTPMTTSGSRNERKNEQQGACHSQSSCSIREIAQIDRTGKRGAPCSASCVKSMVEGPTLRRLRTSLR